MDKDRVKGMPAAKRAPPRKAWARSRRREDKAEADGQSRGKVEMPWPAPKTRPGLGKPGLLTIHAASAKPGMFGGLFRADSAAHGASVPATAKAGS